jgi:cytoskeleton protein RodZ
MRGISLDEIVASTKISRRHLQALEDEQFELLPGGIFNRSYVRAYAKCVGIDEEQAVAAYQQAVQETPTDTRTIAHQHATLHLERPPERSGFPVMPVLILLVVSAGAVGGWKMYQERQREKADAASRASSITTPEQPTGSPRASTNHQSAAPETASSGSASRETQITTASVLAASPVSPPLSATASVHEADHAAATPPFVLVVRPKDRAWVSIKADGTYVVRGIIDPSDTKTVRANTQIIFYVADARTVGLSFNGKEVAAEEPTTGPETLVFTARGLTPGVPAQ